MYKYVKDGITILTVLDTRRAKKSGLFPVKVQVIYKRIQKYYNTGKELNVEDWEKLADTKSKILIEIRTDMQSSFDKIKEVIQNLDSDGDFSFDALNIRLSKGDVTPLTPYKQNRSID